MSALKYLPWVIKIFPYLIDAIRVSRLLIKIIKSAPDTRELQVKEILTELKKLVDKKGDAVTLKDVISSLG